MNLIFDRGDRAAPVGHALIYFQGNDGSILATYVSVPPIAFDISKFLPPFLAGAMQGVDLGGTMGGTPMPPVPQVVESVEYLRALADHRHDDLVFAGGTMEQDQMRLIAEAAEAAQLYGDLYDQSSIPTASPAGPSGIEEVDRYADLSDLEKITELSRLTGRLRDSLRDGGSDPDTLSLMESVARALPAKYRASDLVAAAAIPGTRGQRLAELYVERAYKLYHEEYLDLQRLDHEIEALRSSEA